jgi:putative membrane protein
MWDMDDGMGWWMLLGSFWMIVFWIGVIWAFIALINRSGGPSSGESALDIAKKRYARGEISKEDFDRLRQDLS